VLRRGAIAVSAVAHGQFEGPAFRGEAHDEPMELFAEVGMEVGPGQFLARVLLLQADGVEVSQNASESYI
jgi:hypothetical protein